jgi:hypothetical protein
MKGKCLPSPGNHFLRKVKYTNLPPRHQWIPAQKVWVKLSSANRDMKRTDDASVLVMEGRSADPEPVQGDAGQFEQYSPSS